MENLVPIVLGLFLLAALLRIDFYFNIVYLLAGVYLLARIWARYGLRHLDAHRHLVNRAFPGERVKVELVIRNTGKLPIPWVEIHDSLPVELITPPFYREVITLKSKEDRRFTYGLECYKRGYYAIGPLWVHTGDLMGMTPDLSTYNQHEYIIVYPHVVPLDKLGLPTHSPLAVLPAPAPLFEDPSRISGVRTYQAGDSPRRIHWTASASTGELLVKRYQPAIARETLICLDLDLSNYASKRLYDAVELAIVTAASLATHITNQEKLGVGLSTQAVDPLLDETVQFSLPPRQERAHLMSLLEVLARAQMTEQAPLPFPDFLRQQSVTLSWGCTIVVITGRENQALLDTLLYLRRAGFVIALVLVMPLPTEQTLEHRAESLNIPVYYVWREEELETI